MRATIAASGRVQTETMLIGRSAELAALETMLLRDGPRVIHLSGAAGIGKSSLVRAFSDRARASGATVVRLDCRAIEPSPDVFLPTLARASGARGHSIERIARQLATFETAIVVLEGYELFWLLDAFIRLELGPRMPDSVRLLLVGRNGPVGAWLTSPEWGERFRSISLGPLTKRDALALLARFGVEGEAARRINAIAHGHPLALTVAARRGAGANFSRPEDSAMGAVMELVAGDYLATATDPETRTALEAASVLRRATESLLGAVLPGAAPGDSFDRLRSLPFVEVAADGLFVHDAIRDAIATSLLAKDPERHRQYRIAAWRQLRTEVAHATSATIWRYTADILYLLQNYLIREGFFPTGYQPLAVEPARDIDGEAIRAIAKAHEGPEGLAVVNAWWEERPESFRVCRDAAGETVGAFIVAKGQELTEEIIAADPIAAAWAEDMRSAGGPASSLLLRRLLDREEGEANSGSRGAFGVDVKRTYMEMRPGLRRIYLCGIELENFDWCEPLGFEDVQALRRTLDSKVYRTFRLDMGPGSVDAWLGKVVADELGIPIDERDEALFDDDSAELVIGGLRVSLTPLECGVIRLLQARAGRPVSRADLVEHVWGYKSDATSNVVDAVVLSLRRKLGERATAIETVRGVGYRFRP